MLQHGIRQAVQFTAAEVQVQVQWLHGLQPIHSSLGQGRPQNKEGVTHTKGLFPTPAVGLDSDSVMLGCGTRATQGCVCVWRAGLRGV